MFKHFSQWAAPDVLEMVHGRSRLVTVVTPATAGSKRLYPGPFRPYKPVTMPSNRPVTMVTAYRADRLVTRNADVGNASAANQSHEEVAEFCPPHPAITNVTALTRETDKESIEERAAILQYDANVPSDWCEGVTRLLAMPKPMRLADQVWRQLLDNTTIFIDRWARPAHGLGWDAVDIWGCHRHRPTERVDCTGVLWLLRGNAIVAMSEAAASIRTRTGAIQNYYLNRHRPDGVVPAWELRG